MCHCRCLLKKSGCRTPRIELEEIGPSFDLVLRRTHLASDDLYKLAHRQPKALKVKIPWAEFLHIFPDSFDGKWELNSNERPCVLGKRWLTHLNGLGQKRLERLQTQRDFLFSVYVQSSAYDHAGFKYKKSIIATLMAPWSFTAPYTPKNCVGNFAKFVLRVAPEERPYCWLNLKGVTSAKLPFWNILHSTSSDLAQLWPVWAVLCTSRLRLDYTPLTLHWASHHTLMLCSRALFKKFSEVHFSKWQCFFFFTVTAQEEEEHFPRCLWHQVRPGAHAEAGSVQAAHT